MSTIGTRLTRMLLLTVTAIAPFFVVPVSHADAGKHVKLQGHFEEIHGELPGSDVEEVTYLNTGQTKYRLHLPHGKEFAPGQEITVEGDASGSTLTASTVEATADPAPLPAATGTKSLLVIRVGWNGLAPTATAAQAYDFVFGAGASSTDSWFHTASYNQIDWQGEVTSEVLWIDPPAACSRQDPRGLDPVAQQADAAATTAGYNLSLYPYRMILVPEKNICGARAWGETWGSARHTWIGDGLYDQTNGYERHLPVHELGHNLGLNHSHGLSCDPDVLNTLCLASSANVVDYGNPFDAMGNDWPGNPVNGVAQYGVQPMERLGWLSGRIQTVTTSGTYTLSPMETVAHAYPQALKVVTGTRTYWVEFRQPLGVDSYMAVAAYKPTNGVLVTMQGSDSGSLLLDATPGTNPGFCSDCDWYDSQFISNQTFTDVDGGFTVKVLGTSSNGASVQVTYPNSTPSADVSVSVVGSGNVNVGDDASVTLTLANAGPSAAANVSLSDVLPAGLRLESFAADAGVSCTAAGSLSCSVASLAAGAQAQVRLVVAPVVGGTIVHSASVSAQTTDPAAGNNTAAQSVASWGFDCTKIGTAGADLLAGTTARDVLCGLGGNDTLSGSDGNDQLYGGDGNDTLNGDAGDDVLAGGPDDDAIHGGANSLGGFDRLSFADAQSSMVVNMGQLHAWDDQAVPEDAKVGYDAFDGVEAAIGSAFDDTMLGGSGNDKLEGVGGNDKLYGYGGNDILDGGVGNDLVNGGDGIDYVSYAASGSAVSVDLALTVQQNTLGQGLDTLSNLENVTGSNYADTISGNAVNNALDGGLGNDVLSGRDGVDTLHGNEGDDRLYGGNGDDLLYGDMGNDLLDGQLNLDTCSGGGQLADSKTNCEK